MRIPLSLFPLAVIFAAAASPAFASDPCRPGIYANPKGDFVVIGPAPTAPLQGQRYLFLDGRRGRTNDADAVVRCYANIATVNQAGGADENWPRQATRETDASFDSASTRLAGRLIEPAQGPARGNALVVMVHGSEKTPAIETPTAYLLAAQGISVFVYDKRGTGASAGEYTQNFELLADDAAAALAQARKMAAARFSRAGFYGGSQGGWVAPLAATRAPADSDFVAVGFGLVVSLIEEDRAQLLDEALRMKLNAATVRDVEKLSQATARIMRSHFQSGFEELDALRQRVAGAAWAKTIKGEHSGDMLRMSDADLRRIGRARFDNLELIWDYDAAAAIAKLKVPLLWVLAAEDREAPIKETRALLLKRMAAGQKIDAYLFPDTDHGMVEYRENADGSRTPTRITDGYFKLIADWMKQEVGGGYGRGVLLK